MSPGYRPHDRLAAARFSATPLRVNITARLLLCTGVDEMACRQDLRAVHGRAVSPNPLLLGNNGKSYAIEKILTK
jgi:hypothetical protein